MSRKKDEYFEKVVPALKKKLGRENDLAVPKLEKIVLSRAINVEEAKNEEVLKRLIKELEIISGQKAVVTEAKNSIANFKLREGMPNGIKVTLRGLRMYEFFDQLLSLVLPRFRDFQGVKAKGSGSSFTLGIADPTVFIPIQNMHSKKAGKIKGLQVSINLRNSKSFAETKAFLEEFGFPFEKGKSSKTE